MMRAFIAIPLPESLKQFIKEIQQELIITDADLTIIPPENLHITLKFLGEITQQQVDEIVSILSTISSPQFIISLTSFGAFSSTDHITSIWLSAESNKLNDLTKNIHDQLAHIKTESYGPIPHLTLARMKSPKNKEKIQSILNHQIPTQKFTATAFNLYKSNLTPDGPAYSKQAEFQLINTQDL
jgi:RNA 2',3'-cyclic 3'-phosphodiesterase